MSDNDDDKSTETIVESLVDTEKRRKGKETKREDGPKEKEKKKKNVYVRVCCVCVQNENEGTYYNKHNIRPTPGTFRHKRGAQVCQCQWVCVCVCNILDIYKILTFAISSVGKYK